MSVRVSARVREYECLCVSLRACACAQCVRSACAPCRANARRWPSDDNQRTGAFRLQVAVQRIPYIRTLLPSAGPCPPWQDRPDVCWPIQGRHVGRQPRLDRNRPLSKDLRDVRHDTSAPRLELTPATPAPGLGSPAPHLQRNWARPCTGTGSKRLVLEAVAGPRLKDSGHAWAFRLSMERHRFGVLGRYSRRGLKGYSLTGYSRGA